MKMHKLDGKSWVISTALAVLSSFATTSANAADGCKFLLCIAGPWASISECVPTVREVFDDLAKGRPFPTCDMSGEGNSANNTWVTEQQCPIMYRQYDAVDGNYLSCQYPGLINVYIDGALWSQVFWTTRGDTVTWYSDTARTELTKQPDSLPLDDTFANDLANWNGANVSQCTAGRGTPVFGDYGAFVSCTYPDDMGGS